MSKKFLKLIAFLIVILVAIPVFWTLQDAIEYDKTGIVSYALKIIVIYIIDGIVFGFITDYLSKAKGYEKGFAWGFLLGPIGLLVVGFRPSRKRDERAATTSDDVETIAKLAKLHEQGILTDEEFQRKKTDIPSKL